MKTSWWPIFQKAVKENFKTCHKCQVMEGSSAAIKYFKQSVLRLFDVFSLVFSSRFPLRRLEKHICWSQWSTSQAGVSFGPFKFNCQT